MKSKPWLIYALITTSFWGVWGALITITEKAGFPATLGYTVWSLTMILPAMVALKLVNWKLDYDKKSILFGAIIGFTGAGGQMILFTKALSLGPAYLIFPIISLSPVITILLSRILLKENASKLGWLGIFLALVAIPLLSYSDPSQAVAGGQLWLIFALLVFLAWGVQGYFFRFANQTMKAESIFFYMMVTGIMLAPVAIFLTDFSQPINWGFKGPYLAYLIQTLNAVGALCLVYAFRYGKAIIVSPLTNAVAPIITVVLSLILYRQLPHYVIVIGIVIAIIATLMLAIEDETESTG